MQFNELKTGDWFSYNDRKYQKIDDILERDIPDCSAPGWVYRTRNAVDLITGENRFIFGTCEVKILKKKI